MFYEEIRNEQGLPYILFYPLRILYNSKSMLMATSLVTNAVVVTRVHCILTNRVRPDPTARMRKLIWVYMYVVAYVI